MIKLDLGRYNNHSYNLTVPDVQTELSFSRDFISENIEKQILQQSAT